MIIIGIESSCDETAVAVVKDKKEVLSSVVASQIDVHTEFGGVVPEVASRIHVENISYCIEKALNDAERKKLYKKVSKLSSDCKLVRLIGGARKKKASADTTFTRWCASCQDFGFCLPQTISSCTSFGRAYLCQ